MENLNFRATEPIWSSIPTELLLAELSKRDDARPKCGSGEKGAYNTGLHVFALGLVLFLSTVSCGVPLFSRRSTKGGGGKLQKKILFYCQHFGTGVLMATAFVHLLPTAFSSLTDPCLPRAFHKGYRPLAGLIAMVFALAVVALESYLTTRGAGHTHSHNMYESDNDDEAVEGLFNGHSNGFSDQRGYVIARDDVELQTNEASHGLVANASPLPQSTPMISPTITPPQRISGDRFNDDVDDDTEGVGLIVDSDELGRRSNDNAGVDGQAPTQRSSKLESGSGLPLSAAAPNAEEQKRLLLQCVLLEAGILFHSVFIGMALSVATGPTFAVFLVAIAFHQSFEGLALGSRIAAIQFPRSSWQPWLMVLAFGTTTPIGQAIGLIVHRFYDPMSQTGLLMVGFMNAISSGLLLFAGLVQLLAEDFLTEKSYKVLRGRRRLEAFGSVVAGATLMALVGAIA